MQLDNSSNRSGPPALSLERAAKKRQQRLDHQAGEAQKSGADSLQIDNADTTLANFALPGD